MKNFFKTKGKRLTALLLSGILCLMAMPMSAFAFTAEEGKTVNASYGGRYVGADGAEYSTDAFQALIYDTSGNVTVRNEDGHHRTKLMISDSTGTRQIMCIESGVSYNAGGTLKSVNGTNSSYFQNLPYSAQYGIMLTSLYGWAPGKPVPVSGCNEDDFSLATQSILWEYQQQLRTSPTSRQNNAYGVPGDTYIKSIQGRPAEQCYHWILGQMANHATVPSFASNQSNGAQTYTLKYNQASDNYRLTLTDTNNTLSDLQFSTASGITVSRNGNQYTFTSKSMIENAVMISAQKNVPVGETFMVWGTPGYQTMMTGAKDPVYMYLNIKTETTGVGHIVKHSEDGKVEGISFAISGNGVNKTVTTVANGTVDIELMPGVYTVTEQTIDKYEPQSVQRVTIVSGNTASVTFSNTLKRGDLSVIKNSEDKLVEGVTFHLFGTSLSGIAVDEYAVTDANGKATFKDVLISGATPYTLEEVDTAIRYVVPEKQTASIEWEKVTTRTFNNILKKFSVTVTKSDSEKGLPQGNATLADAKYGIFKGEQLIDTYYTDINGQFTTKEYICDTDWTIREIEPSEGYLLDTTVHTVGAEPKLYEVEHNLTSNDVTEDVVKGNIAIIKHTDNGDTQVETPENGATFEVYLKSAGSFENANADERDNLLCDENGFAETKDMPYGVYTVHQTSGWEGKELMKDFDVFISADGQTYRYLINNAPFESYINVVKVDAETGKTIPYAGAGFQIFDPDGNLVTMTFTYPTPTTIDTFYTDAEGSLVTPEMLPYGTGYSLIEVQAPYGYVLDNTPVKFDITEANSTEESGVTVVKVEKNNMPQKGTITIEKTGEVFFGVSVSGAEGEESIYQPLYAVQGLPDAVYEIKAAEDVYTPDGTLRYSMGEVVDTIKTNSEGLATSKELYLGKYEVKETTAPYGMILNSEIHSVELTYAGQGIPVTETATSFVNERQKAEISLTKTLESNELFGIGKNGEIKNVSFGIFAASELVSASGTFIPTDGLIEIISLDENGNATFKTDLPIGNYYVKELSTDEHYVLNDTKFPVVFDYAGQEIPMVDLAVNDGKPIDNNIIYGSVSGKKVTEDGTGLGGALMGLFKTDTTEYTKDTALMTTTSNDDGSFSFAEIPFGNWIVREIEQPKGYVLNDTAYSVTISKVEEVVDVEIVNVTIRGNIALTKVDADYPENKLTGAEFEVYKDSNDNGELDKDDELLGTLTEKEIGEYEMTYLHYGRYFVKETKAPEGFLLDTGVYPVFIDENGKIYSVENKAGIGFINNAQKGSLKIVKTSSDGKIEGFSFRVIGSNGYDQSFVTNKNGEIFIEGLRIGEYTVSEVSDSVSAAYVLPADKQATIIKDSTTIVEMFNDKPNHPDAPQTGDNSNMALWLMLTALSAAGVVLCSVLGRRKMKKEENN